MPVPSPLKIKDRWPPSSEMLPEISRPPLLVKTTLRFPPAKCGGIDTISVPLSAATVSVPLRVNVPPVPCTLSGGCRRARRPSLIDQIADCLIKSIVSKLPSIPFRILRRSPPASALKRHQ